MKAQITCLNIDCPDKKSICCGAISRIESNMQIEHFVCSQCSGYFKGNPCTAEDKVNNWFEDCDWRKEFEEKFWDARKCEEHLYCLEEFIETLLIKILAKCETAKDARECRHIIKYFILKDYHQIP